MEHAKTVDPNVDPSQNTIVIVLDEQHAKEFQTVLPNWLKWHPELREQPCLVLCDSESELSHPSSSVLLKLFQEIKPHIEPWHLNQRCESQRDLALWQYLAVAPHLIKTPRWTKIDTDVAAYPSGTGDAWRRIGQDAAVTGSPWGYTKPRGALAKLETWAKSHLPLTAAPPHFTSQPGKDECPRLIGWLGTYDTEFTRQVANICLESPPPVISHDTLMWYAAHCLGQKWRAIPYNVFGWSHHRPKYLAAQIAAYGKIGDAGGTHVVCRNSGGGPHTHTVIQAIRDIDARRVAEIGVYRGTTSNGILGNCPDVVLYMVDPWSEVAPDSPYYQTRDTIGRSTQAEHDGSREIAMLRTDQFEQRRVVYQNTSIEAARFFRNESLDLVYIDGAHDYENVKADIAAWWPIVRPGGILAGHDYKHRRYMVAKAVDEFMARNGLSFRRPVEHTVWQLTKPRA